jgi:hypothetical protein
VVKEILWGCSRSLLFTEGDRVFCSKDGVHEAAEVSKSIPVEGAEMQ